MKEKGELWREPQLGRVSSGAAPKIQQVVVSVLSFKRTGDKHLHFESSVRGNHPLLINMVREGRGGRSPQEDLLEPGPRASTSWGKGLEGPKKTEMRLSRANSRRGCGTFLESMLCWRKGLFSPWD